jgi:hypothetical protein
MRKIITIIIATMMGSTVLAQDSQTFNKPVLCADRDRIIKELTGSKYQEMPVWLGMENTTGDRYSLFVNTKNGSWTLLQFDEKIACIIGAGVRSQSIPSGPAV